MKKKLLFIPAALVALVLMTAGSCQDQNIVDGKAELSVPGTPGAVCYLLEINVEDGAGGELGEEYTCVNKAEWDRNRMGKDWVDENGQLKK